MSAMTHRLAPRAVAMLGLFFSLAAPATAAVTEQFYQRGFDLACAGVQCKIELPKVAAKTRLNIRWVSCWMTSLAEGRSGILQFTYGGGDPLAQYLPAIRTTPMETVFIQKMDILIVPQKTAEIRLTANGTAFGASCTLTGRLQKIS